MWKVFYLNISSDRELACFPSSPQASSVVVLCHHFPVSFGKSRELSQICSNCLLFLFFQKVFSHHISEFVKCKHFSWSRSVSWFNPMRKQSKTKQGVVGTCVCCWSAHVYCQYVEEASHGSERRRGRGRRKKLESDVGFDPLVNLTSFLQGQGASNQKTACSPHLLFLESMNKLWDKKIKLNSWAFATHSYLI